MWPDQINDAVAYIKVAIHDDKPASINVSQDDSPVLRTLQNELFATYIVDVGSSFQYVSNRHISSASVSSDDLHAIGVQNLRKLAQRKLAVNYYGSIYAVTMGGNFEASLILLDDLWDQALSHLAPNGFVAALPARDVLAFCDVRSAQGIAELHQVVERLNTTPGADHLLTRQLYKRSNGGWQLYVAA